MQYASKIILPEERILYNGRVHAIVYAPGFLLLIASFMSARFLAGLWVDMGYSLTAQTADFFSVKAVPVLFSAFLFIMSLYFFIKAFIVTHTTELVVTTARVIAKFGLYSTTTIEMDRNKIAGVVIFQGPVGKMLNYGTVLLRGFSGNITGLPPIADPYALQREINSRKMW